MGLFAGAVDSFFSDPADIPGVLVLLGSILSMGPLLASVPVARWMTGRKRFLRERPEQKK
jgi:hypothetical protein